MTDAPTPVFVLGLQRSGTTWLASLLGGHPDVACIESEDHFGIHESIFFSHFARAYGDLEDDACFERFARDFGDSDYYLLSGLEEDWLAKNGPRNYVDAFRSLMDEVARRRGARVWVEKSPHHTLLAYELAEWFPDACFVGVVRDPVDQARSSVFAPGRDPGRYPGRALPIVTAGAASALYERFLRRFDAGNDRSCLVRFADMKEDREREMRRVAEFLGLDFDPRMTVERFQANTSFRSSADRAKAFSPADRALVKLAHATARLLPIGALLAIRKRRRAQRNVVWPDWCWRRRPRAS